MIGNKAFFRKSMVLMYETYDNAKTLDLFNKLVEWVYEWENSKKSKNPLKWGKNRFIMTFVKRLNSSGSGAIPNRRYSPRPATAAEPVILSSEKIPVPTVKSG